jgi:hypothetical protein
VGQFLGLLETAAGAGEDAYLVYNALNAGLGEIAQALDCIGDQALTRRFNAFVQKQLAPVVDRLDAWTFFSPKQQQHPAEQVLLVGLVRCF